MATVDASRIANPDSGLIALATILGMHRLAVDVGRMRHEIGHAGPLDAAELLRVAKRQPGVSARAVHAGFDRLKRLPLPAIAEGQDGWFLIGRVASAEALVKLADGPVERLDRETLAAIWTGRIVLLTTRDGIEGARRFDIRWFLPQIVRYRRLIGEVLLITLAINLLGLASPLFFQNVIDKALVHNTRATLRVLVIGFVAVSMWEVAFGWLRTRLYSETSQKLDVELGARLFRHLMHIPVSYFESRRVGDTVSRVRQLETIREFLTNASLSILVDPLFAIVFLAMMWVYSPILLAVVVATIPFYIMISLFVTAPLRDRLADKFERGAANNALLVESVSGIQTVKAAAVEPQWQNRWERQLAGYSAANQHVINLANSSTQAVQLVSKLSTAALLYFGAMQVIAGVLSVGGLVAFNMLAQRVYGPVLRMAQLWQDFQQVRLSIDRLGDVLNTPQEAVAASRVALPSLRGTIKFHNIRFRYRDDGPWALDGIDVTIPAGGTLGIVGPSGSGKSTLTKLLQRLHAPIAGSILLDGNDIGQLDPAWLRRQIGVVLQENLLFNCSIRENIALADPAMPIASIMAAATLAGAHEFIVGLPAGYDTMVEERGVNLSGGQRQRIAIARALITQPRILIFDEATSALDAESEDVIQANLKAMARGRTVLIIAHRLSAVRQCDRIMTIDGGRLTEIGSHAELLARDGRYAGLYRRQMGLAEAAQ